MRIGDTIANEFNVFSANYTDDMTHCVPHYLKLMACFTEDLPENLEPGNILDLGCGNGNVTARLLPLFAEANYTLVDASEQMIHICEELFKQYHVEYVTSYFKDFKFKDNCYDMITAGFSLHHCDSEEKKQLFKSIYSSLKKGGVFSYSDLMIDKNKPEHLKLLKDWKAFVHKSFPDGEKWEWLMEHYNEFDKPDDYQKQRQWLEEAGFTTIEIIAKEGYWMHLRGIRD